MRLRQYYKQATPFCPHLCTINERQDLRAYSRPPSV